MARSQEIHGFRASRQAEPSRLRRRFRDPHPYHLPEGIPDSRGVDLPEPEPGRPGRRHRIVANGETPEVAERTGELNQANVFLESVLGSVRAGVVVLDTSLNVESWNALAEDMWGLRADEARHKNFFSLDIGLPVGNLREPIRECLSGDADFAEVVVDATNRRGRAVRCKVICSPMRDQSQNHHGVILLMEPEPVEA